MPFSAPRLTRGESRIYFRLMWGMVAPGAEIGVCRTPAVRLVNWYMSKLHKAAHSDPVPALAFHRVGNLLAPPPSVMHPRVAIRVLWGNLGFSRRQSQPERLQATAAVR